MTVSLPGLNLPVRVREIDPGLLSKTLGYLNSDSSPSRFSKLRSRTVSPLAGVFPAVSRIALCLCPAWGDSNGLHGLFEQRSSIAKLSVYDCKATFISGVSPNAGKNEYRVNHCDSEFTLLSFGLASLNCAIFLRHPATRDTGERGEPARNRRSEKVQKCRRWQKLRVNADRDEEAGEAKVDFG
jgi:hypothetical protein